MIRKSIYTLLASLSAVLGAHALDVNVTAPGTLAGQNISPDVTTIKVNGPLDTRDMDFLGTLDGLTTLDMSGATLTDSLIPANTFAGSKIQTLSLPAQEPVRIGAGAFAGSALKAVTLPENVTYVGDGAFTACESLGSVAMTRCGYGVSVFADCSRLSVVDLHGCDSVATSMFRNTLALATVNGSGSLKAIGKAAFEGSGIRRFTFGPVLECVGEQAFAGSDIENAALENCTRLTTLGEEAFAECLSLKTAALPSSVRTLPRGVFFGDVALESLVLPANLEAYGQYAMKGTISMTSASMPEGLTTIAPYAMQGMSAVNELTMPSTLVTVGTGAMEKMTALTKIDATAMAVPAVLGDSVWNGLSQQDIELHVAEDDYNLYASAPQWQDFKILKVTGVNDIAGDGMTAVSDLQGRFNANTLEIVSSGAPVSLLRIYNTNGVLLMQVAPDRNNVAVDTTGLSGKVFVISVQRQGMPNAALKLIRP